MVEKEIKEFFEPIKTRYDNYTYPSNFTKVCNEVMTEVTKSQFIEILKKYESTMWSNNELAVNDLLKEQLIKNASEIFSAMVGARMQTVINNMKNGGY